MHNKLVNDLNYINKIILHSNDIFDQEIDILLFAAYLKETYIFIFNSLNELWNTYIKNYELYDKENFIKTYYFTLKRFQKFLYKIAEENSKNSFLNENSIELSKIINLNNERFTLIKDKKFNPGSYEAYQLINEEEYNILFENKNKE